MNYTTYDYSGEELATAAQGQWAGDSPKKSWLPHPYRFILSNKLAGYDGSDSGTTPPDCFVLVDDTQDTQQWSLPVQNAAAVVGYSTSGETETEDLMEEPLGRMSISDTYSYSECSTSLYHPQPISIDTPPPTVSSGSPTPMNALHTIGSGTPTGLRDASCYSDAYWVAPAVGYLEPQGATSVIQVQSATSYYAAHQPIPPRQRSSYSSLANHLEFMIDVESREYPRKISLHHPTPSSQSCLSAVKTPLTSRHRKPVGQSLSLLSLPPSPASFGSVSQTNSSAPRALNNNQPNPQPPVQEPAYQPYTMLSTKAVKGRHLLPAIPAPPVVVLSNATAASSLSSSSPSANVASRVPLKREATEQLEEDLMRSRPVSRRGSAASACESNTSSSSSSQHSKPSSHSRSSSSDSFTIPPPYRRGSGSSPTSTILPKGTSAAAVAAAAAVSAVTSAQNMHLVYPHPPVVFDFAMGSSKGSSSSLDLSGNGSVGDGASMNNATRNIKEPRRPSLACTFCRERKIACGRPPNDSEDQTCNQCARRGFLCEYTNDPKKRRGEGKGTRKKRGVSTGTTGTESSAPSTPSTQ